MKKIIICAMLMAIAATSFCQETNPSEPVTRADYLQKSKSQKTAAWILLGSGAVMFGIAAPGNVSFGTLGTLVVVGTLATLGSIPLFLAAHRNKKRGMALSASLKMEDASVVQSYSRWHSSYPAILLKIDL